MPQNVTMPRINHAYKPRGSDVKTMYRGVNSSNYRSQRQSRVPSFAAGATAGDIYGKLSPTQQGAKAGASIGGLEAEFLLCLLLIGATVFLDTESGYSDKMLAVMKRGTCACAVFFLLSILSSASANASRFARAFGGLILVGILLGQAGLVPEWDKFFSNDWKGVDDSSSSSSNAPAGQQNTIPGTGAATAVKNDTVSKWEEVADSTLAGSGQTIGDVYAVGRVGDALITGNGSALGHALASVGEHSKSVIIDTLGSFGIHI